MVRQTLACTMSPRDIVGDHITVASRLLTTFQSAQVKSRSNIHPGREVVVGETSYFAAL
jgi:hypothetical protein